ncbi:MAG: hypothetical protein ACPLYD_14275 [Anaerolineae bacterium]
MKNAKRFTRWLSALVILLASIALPAVYADDGNYYNFDYEDFWKEYREWGYPVGTRLPCNGGGSEARCTWAWELWYEHGTALPRFGPETWNGRTVSGYALMMYWYDNKNIHAGVYRKESVQPGRIYCFTMWSRSGLDSQNPAPPNARIQIGISPTGDYPGQLVLTPERINNIIWSEEVNPQYRYERQGIVAQAKATQITVFTRARPDPQNSPYVFWDEGAFVEIPLMGDAQPLPPDSPLIQSVSVVTSTNSAQISWSTAPTRTLGQILYRRIGSTESITVTIPETMTHKVYLPVVHRMGPWQRSEVGPLGTSHAIQLQNLEPKSIYEFVVVSYGYINGTCTAVVSGSTTPRRFYTP